MPASAAPIARLAAALRRLRDQLRDGVVSAVLAGRHGPPGLCVAVVGAEPYSPPPFTLKDLIGDGFLFAVPKHRRTIEKRMKRKFGSPDGDDKMLRPKTNLQDCDECGSPHEIGVLCPYCYKRVEEETRAMQAAIVGKLGLNPIDKEVVVLYDGEKPAKCEETWNGKQIVEMQKPRPAWYSQNLLQRTTKETDESKDVKPSQLA